MFISLWVSITKNWDLFLVVPSIWLKSSIGRFNWML